MNRIDINCDLGESFGNYRLGMDEEVLKYISSANVACGFHAGDPLVMERTVRLAAACGTSVGAHPGYPDLVGFGRRRLEVSAAEMKAMVMYQIGALEAFCRAAGICLRHVKPHGAMYNMAAGDAALAHAVCEAVYEVNPKLILLGLSGSELLCAAQETGLAAASEVFADRAYEEDGSLVARRRPGAMITDEEEAIARVIRMVKEGCVRAVTGRDIPIRADSVCVHGDSPQALSFVKRIREALENEGISVTNFEGNA